MQHYTGVLAPLSWVQFIPSFGNQPKQHFKTLKTVLFRNDTEFISATLTGRQHYKSQVLVSEE